MQTLLLYADYTNQLSYYDDWREAIMGYPLFTCQSIDLVPINRPPLSIIYEKIAQVEFIIIHHSLLGDTLNYLKPITTALKLRKNKLIAFVGNEVNLPILGMSAKINFLKEVEADIIITQLLLETGQWLYAECLSAQIISLPHALNPQAFPAGPSCKKRKIDLGSRSACYGVYLGDNERNDIIHYFQRNAEDYGLLVDLSNVEDAHRRYTRLEWSQFLRQCKMTVSTESGSFYLQRSDQLLQDVIYYLKKNHKIIVYPSGSLWVENLKKELPASLKKWIKNLVELFRVNLNDAHFVVDWEELNKRFFNQLNRAPFYSKAISSRHFDAIGSKTLNVMFEGRFNDILRSSEHYFALKRDYSNKDELIALLNDADQMQKIVNNAYEYVIEAHTHRHRLDDLAAIL